MRVRFLRKAGWYTAKAVQLPGEMSYDVEEFAAGEVYDLDDTRAQSFVNKGDAEFVGDDVEQAATAAAPKSLEQPTGTESAPEGEAGANDPAVPSTPEPSPSAAPPRPRKKS